MVFMRKIRCIGYVLVFLFLPFLPWSFLQVSPPVTNVGIRNEDAKTSSEEIYNQITTIFEDKDKEVTKYGFYPQLYESSLQATYYGLYVLDAIGKLEHINGTQIKDYIMSKFNLQSNSFMDTYSYRYLDTDFSKTLIYPLTSVLQIHCYATLALDLLNDLDEIDNEQAIAFIWSCYNPITSGFIGQPYSADLKYYAKISTMDNTYYAVKALDTLGENWMEHTQERNELVSYINSLQVTINSSWEFGGFANDNERYFFPLRLYADVNMFSSYYCIKTLQLFGMEDTIDLESCYLFLEELYNPTDYSFQYTSGYEEFQANIPTTALALDLAHITGFSAFNESGTIEFIFNHRNLLGIWDGSTEISYHELLDTFQVIRVLSDSGLISLLTFADTIQITNILLDYFFFEGGFCLVSKDYTTLELLHTIISSYDLYGQISELDIHQLYQQISNAFYHQAPLYNGFVAIAHPEIYGGVPISFRSYPLEFDIRGNGQFLENSEYFTSHKSTFYALDSLRKIFKLDDFGSTHDLNELLTHIVSTQFLNSSYPEYYGAFSYMLPSDKLPSNLLLDGINFEYTYYAVRCLELLAAQLNIGDITFLPIDISALETYINSYLVETSEEIYFDAPHSDNPDAIIENTYYMVYVLKSLDLFSLNTEKIATFILRNLNYSNNKNTYYSFRLNRLMGSNVGFNSVQVHYLVEHTYSESYHEYYLTRERKEINQEIFLWICEMIKNDPLKIQAFIPQECVLGGNITIKASLYNIILSYFGSNITFTLESLQLGFHTFETLSSNNFSLTVAIPQKSENYPTIEAILYAYNSDIKLAELSISIKTFYPKGVYEEVSTGVVALSISFITIPGGIIIFSEKKLRKAKLKI
jgi:prenyltransferase beta subunit